jgi:PAS domain S-box-containing protein
MVEYKLSESEEHYRTLFNTIDEGFCIIEVIFDKNEKPIDYCFLETNPSFEKQTGLIGAQGKRMRELAPKHEEHWFEIYGQVAVTGQPVRFVNRAEELHRWYDVYAFRLGRPKNRQVAILFNDITERKQFEDALRESEERYRSLFDNSIVGISQALADGHIISGNIAYAQMYGYTNVKEMITEVSNVGNLYSKPEEREEVLRILREKGVMEPREIEVIRRNGTRFAVLVAAREIRDSKGNLQCYQAEHIDITGRKQAEKALQEEEVRLRVALTPIDMAVFNQDLELRYTWMYQPQIGYTTAQVVGKTDAELLPPDAASKTMEIKRRVLENGMGTRDEVEVAFEDRTLYYDLVVEPLRNLAGKIIGITGASLDITERKRVEKALYVSLREKEILLREIHHRVMNNMQVISSLLDLQASSTGNPELTEILNESQKRIRVMALVHEKLYDSKDFAKIDLAGYVRTLSKELFQVHNIRSGRIDLIIQADSAIYVDINKATPCGLVLNELISNVLKYAFPKDKPGKLQISIRETENSEIEIVTHDNGLGLPDDIDIHQPHSVGLHLVNGLVTNQLGGKIEVRRDAGTEFRIKFPTIIR